MGLAHEQVGEKTYYRTLDEGLAIGNEQDEDDEVKESHDEESCHIAQPVGET